jgi:hypothetical protein
MNDQPSLQQSFDRESCAARSIKRLIKNRVANIRWYNIEELMNEGFSPMDLLEKTNELLEELAVDELLIVRVNDVLKRAILWTLLEISSLLGQSAPPSMLIADALEVRDFSNDRKGLLALRRILLQHLGLAD